jgi:hypothetical protein
MGAFFDQEVSILFIHVRLRNLGSERKRNKEKVEEIEAKLFKLN